MSTPKKFDPHHKYKGHGPNARLMLKWIETRFMSRIRYLEQENDRLSRALRAQEALGDVIQGVTVRMEQAIETFWRKSGQEVSTTSTPSRWWRTS